MTDFVLTNFLPYQLSVLSARISREFSAVYKDRFDLSVAEWRVLAHLSQAKTAISVREIVARVDMDKSKISRAVSRLEKRDVVSKGSNTGDKRLLALQLTDKGRAMMEELVPMACSFEDRWLKKLGHDADTFRTAVRQALN